MLEPWRFARMALRHKEDSCGREWHGWYGMQRCFGDFVFFLIKNVV